MNHYHSLRAYYSYPTDKNIPCNSPERWGELFHLDKESPVPLCGGFQEMPNDGLPPSYWRFEAEPNCQECLAIYEKSKAKKVVREGMTIAKRSAPPRRFHPGQPVRWGKQECLIMTVNVRVGDGLITYDLLCPDGSYKEVLGHELRDLLSGREVAV